MKPQEHLREVVSRHGSGDATAPVRQLLDYGLQKKLEQDAALRAAEGKDKRDYPYVTDAGKCRRQLFFALTNQPKAEVVSLDSYMTLSLGRKAEELYIELLQAAGVTILTQERVELEHDGEKVVGKLDLLIEAPADLCALIPGLEPRELWELKTKNSRALSWVLKRGGPDADDPYRHQVNSYLHAAASDLIPRPTTARGRLVYTAVGATKGEPLFHAWFVPYDPNRATADLAQLAQAMKSARAGVDPGIPEDYLAEYRLNRKPPVFPCGYCDWKSKCWNGGSQ